LAVFSFKNHDDKLIEPSGELIVEITKKTFINFAWVGSILIYLGFLLALLKSGNAHLKNN